MSKPTLGTSGIPYLTHSAGGAGCEERVGRADGRQYPRQWEGAYVTHGGGGAGCSEGLPCADYCWAKKLVAGRLSRWPQYRGLVKDGKWTGKVWEDSAFAAKVAARKKPAVIGVFFLGDLALASECHVALVHVTATLCKQHQFLVPTKRPRLLLEKLRGDREIAIPDNLWLGVSASTQEEYDERVSILCDPETGWPGNKWVSLEPCMGPVSLWSDFEGKTFRARTTYLGPGGIQWVVAGSADTVAHGAAAFTSDIARSLRDQCQASGVPFWLKQAAFGYNLDRLSVDGIGRRRVVSAPYLDTRQHLEAPPAIAAILKGAGKL